MLFLRRAGIWEGLLLDYDWMWIGETIVGLAGIGVALALRPPEGSRASPSSSRPA